VQKTLATDAKSSAGRKDLQESFRSDLEDRGVTRDRIRLLVCRFACWINDADSDAVGQAVPKPEGDFNDSAGRSRWCGGRGSKQKECVETLPAASASERPDHESVAAGVPESHRPGGANFLGSAGKTLRNFVAAHQHHRQNRKADQSNQCCPKFHEIVDVFHGVDGREFSYP